MRIKIVPMSAEHIPMLAELERRCFSQPWSEAMLTEELYNSQARFLTAVYDGGVLGYIGVQEICGECCITSVAVFDEYRRLGVGSALLDAAENGARSRECEFITLEVRVSNAAAVSLYEKRGYQRMGVRPGFYTLPDEDALIMTKVLE